MQYERNSQTTGPHLPGSREQTASPKEPCFSILVLGKIFCTFSCLAFNIYCLYAFSPLPRIPSVYLFKLIQANDTILTFITLLKLDLAAKLELTKDFKFQPNIEADAP